MKILALILFVLLAVQSYGVFGAFMADRIVYKCTLEAGPLCYRWEESRISKFLGKETAEKMEEKLFKAKQDWDERFAEQLEKRNSGDLKEVLQDAEKAAVEGLKTARETAERMLEALKKEK